MIARGPSDCVVYIAALRERDFAAPRGPVLKSCSLHWHFLPRWSLRSLSIRPASCSRATRFCSLAQRWNGRPGFTFVAESADNRQPGVGLDTFRGTIRDPDGLEVLHTGGALSAGNVKNVD